MAVAYRYKMVGIAPGLLAETKDDPSDEAAKYLEDVVNEYARAGWEFHRVDHLDVAQKRGCLGIWLGGNSSFVAYPIITFRRPVASAPASAPREVKSVAKE